MKTNTRPVVSRPTQGFSLPELMVAITIGLIILAAVSTVFVTSRANYTSQESLARLQESARIAISLVTRDLRMAGFYGCPDHTQNMNSVLSPTAGVAYNFSVPIEGVEGDTGTLLPSNVAAAFPVAGTAVTAILAKCPNFVGGKCTGTDAVAIRTSDPATLAPVSTAMNSSSADVVVSTTTGIVAGDIVVVFDCGGADLVKATAVSNASGPAIIHGTGGSPANQSNSLNRTYAPPGGQIAKYVNRMYYVGTGISGYPTLFRQNIDGSSREELIEGIQDLQITYGVASAATDRTPRAYLLANDGNLGASLPNWTKVVSAQLTLTSMAVNTTNPSAPVNASSPDIKPKQFTSTILLRNLQ